MLFSIIVPAYNAEKFIIRCIKSVLNQTYNNFELIVINDGSLDNTLLLIESTRDARLIVLSQENKGVSAARNSGLNIASGDYICFLDADDEFLPNHLEILFDVISNYKKTDFLATRFLINYRSNQKTFTPLCTGNVHFYENVFDIKQKDSEIIWTGCVCIKKEMFLKYGNFEIGLKLGEDTDMWKRIYVHTGLTHIDTVTVQRNRDGSEATKYYSRNYTVDPLNRMKMFLNDTTISNKVKNSLITENELIKLQVVRSHIYDGDKRIAFKKIKIINFKRLPFIRIIVTFISFLIPSSLIRIYLSLKNSGLYAGEIE